MVLNPAGYVVLGDQGAPNILSGRAREVISGGQLVFISGAADVVSSGANSFTATDIQFATGASGVNFAGIAMATVGSNATISVARNVKAIITSAGTVVAGRTVIANGDDAVATATTAGTVIGRALTSAGSEGYTLVQVD